jgi:hypothetical protein
MEGKIDAIWQGIVYNCSGLAPERNSRARVRSYNGGIQFMGTENHGRLKLLIKSIITAVCLVMAIAHPDLLVRAFTRQVSFFKVYHMVWLAIVLLLVKRMVPAWNSKISMGKIFERHYGRPRAADSAKQEKLREKLAGYVHRMNVGAFRTAVYWLVAVLFVGLLYYTGALNRMWLVLTVVFFIFMDQFCVSAWCVFKWIIGNKCCNTCRINNWGYLMAFSTLVYIPSFFTYSILFMSALVVIQWEYLFHKYPERFYELCNLNLQCKNCSRDCGPLRPQSS